MQYRLVRLMAGEGEGLFVIGDADQAIYGFRGASPAYFISVLEDFPSAHRVVLETTYRSTGQIVRAACAVIAHNADRQPVALVAARGEGVGCRLLSVPGETGRRDCRGAGDRSDGGQGPICSSPTIGQPGAAGMRRQGVWRFRGAFPDRTAGR